MKEKIRDGNRKHMGNSKWKVKEINQSRASRGIEGKLGEGKYGA